MPGPRRGTWVVTEAAADIACGFAHAVARPRLTGGGQEVTIVSFYVTRAVREQGADAALIAAIHSWSAHQGALEIHCILPAGQDNPQHYLMAQGFSLNEPMVSMSMPVVAAPAATAIDLPPRMASLSNESEPRLAVTRGATSASTVWHWLIIAAGVTSLGSTDLWSADVIRGALLVFVDVAFMFYLIIYFSLRRYRRQVSVDSLLDDAVVSAHAVARDEASSLSKEEPLGGSS
jgi:hypothetical protein